MWKAVSDSACSLRCVSRAPAPSTTSVTALVKEMPGAAPT